MGYNTVALILNDTIRYDKDNADFGRQVLSAVQSWPGHRPYKSDLEAGRQHSLRLISMSHADYRQVVVVSGNCGRALSHGGKPLAGDLEALANILRDHGWKVSAPKTPKET